MWPSDIIRNMAEANEVTRPWRILNISQSSCKGSSSGIGRGGSSIRPAPSGAEEDSPLLQRWLSFNLNYQSPGEDRCAELQRSGWDPRGRVPSVETDSGFI